MHFFSSFFLTRTCEKLETECKKRQLPYTFALKKILLHLDPFIDLLFRLQLQFFLEQYCDVTTLCEITLLCDSCDT